MTVAELINALQQLPQDMGVLRDWEGQLVEPRTPRVADCHRYSGIVTNASEDYFPEVEDEDYTKFKAVILE